MCRVDVCEEDVEDVRLPGDDILDDEEREESEEKVWPAVIGSSDCDCFERVDEMERREYGG